MYIIFLCLCLIIPSQAIKPIVGAYFGIFDDAYTETIKNGSSIPWSMFDRIYIPFVTIDEYGNLTNGHPYDHDRIINVVKSYKQMRPDGQVFVTTAYSTIIDERYIYAANHSVYFVKSAIKYFELYGVDGIDFDWETANINEYVEYLNTLLSTCIKIFDGKYLVSTEIMPYYHYPETVGSLANMTDSINLMTYGYDSTSIEPMINNYYFHGYPYEKMMLGIESEVGSDAFEIISNKINLMYKYNLKGIFMWRLDNDSRNIKDGMPYGPSTFKTADMIKKALYYDY